MCLFSPFVRLFFLLIAKFTFDEQELAAIWNMGFEADVVQRALAQADGNEERAVHLILSDR